MSPNEAAQKFLHKTIKICNGNCFMALWGHYSLRLWWPNCHREDLQRPAYKAITRQYYTYNVVSKHDLETASLQCSYGKITLWDYNKKEDCSASLWRLDSIMMSKQTETMSMQVVPLRLKLKPRKARKFCIKPATLPLNHTLVLRCCSRWRPLLNCLSALGIITYCRWSLYKIVVASLYKCLSD